MADIREKITRFPVLELTDIQIYNRANRTNGYGRTALHEFLTYAKNQGYSYAIVRIGKYDPDVSLDGNTNFYTKCGWMRFITPTEFSLRFGYFNLSTLA